jgi:hypothetical protein
MENKLGRETRVGWRIFKDSIFKVGWCGSQMIAKKKKKRKKNQN